MTSSQIIGLRLANNKFLYNHMPFNQIKRNTFQSAVAKRHHHKTIITFLPSYSIKALSQQTLSDSKQH